MRILCNYTPAGPHYVRSGWGRVFAACGHEFKFWIPGTKSAFDAFGEYEPDIYLGTTYETSRAVAKCIAARPGMKVALFASAWGPLVDNIDKQVYPLVIASEKEKDDIRRLKAETGRPDFVFIHVTDKYLEGTMGGWRSVGVKPVGILNAADTFEYLNGKRREELACDVTFVGGYWGYKARNLDKYLLPLCHPDAKLNVKIFGNRTWPVAQYMGGIEDREVKNLFASATVCPNVSEPHSTDLGWDIIERPFKVLAAGGFCMSDHVDEIREVFADYELPTAQTPKEFAQLVSHFVKKPEEREAFIQAGRRKVLTDHTYFDRVTDMFQHFGMESEMARVMQVKGEALAGRI